MASLLHEIGKDAFEKTRDIKAGERIFCLIYWFTTMAERVLKEGVRLLSLKDEPVNDCGDWDDEKIWKEGLPSFEEEAAKAPSEIGLYGEIQWAAGLVRDGCNPENIIELSAARYRKSNFQGEDALLYYMLILGFLKILKLSPRVMEMSLLPCLSCEAEERYQDYKERMDAPKLAAKRESLFHYDPVFEDQEILSVKKQLEEKIMQADGKMIRRWLSDIRKHNITVTLHVLSPEAKQKVLSNISRWDVDDLVEDWEETLPIAHSDLMEVLGKVLRILENADSYI